MASAPIFLIQQKAMGAYQNLRDFKFKLKMQNPYFYESFCY